ncbi:hypothetical protein [uncultured Microbacterium sp.]|uniref:hypothetical protein n=1 Tax=uncultured Microbacterium sp. TaxID=191216 RepID=UPI0025D99832|nr:hypothetical protein [uncultured Microbacterium sp.]
MNQIPDAGPSGAADGVAGPSTGSGASVGCGGAARGGAQERRGTDPVDAPVAPARQPVVRVRGSRRARLLAAPGTTAEPAPADERERGAGARPAASGPNDDRMLRDVPPHY